MQNSVNKAVLWIATTIVVVIIYHVCYDLRSLWPTNISWLMEVHHDWGTHYLGWLFYKNEPWQFPLGQVSGYFHPLGTNVGFTDSIPLFAILFKIFRPLLPADFQYFGFWLFTCHLLTAYASILLLKRFGIKDLYIFLSVILITANPVLVYRGLHPALCAHWLIIGSIYLYYSAAVIIVRKILRWQLLLLLLSALINPYLCAMVFGFTLFTPIKLWLVDKAIKARTFVLYQLLSVTLLLFAWYLVGMVTFGGSQEFAVQGGFGLYSLNLNSLVNPWGYSSFLPALSIVSWHQYEAFMYPGIGLLALAMIVLICWLVKRFQQGFRVKGMSQVQEPGKSIRQRKNADWPIVALMIIYTLFAITNVVSLNSKVLFTVPIPKLLTNIGEIFRASGRFFWVPFYLLVFICLSTWSGAVFRDWIKVVVLSVILAIQFYDIRLMLMSRQMTYGSYKVPLNKQWQQLISGSKSVLMYPPFEATFARNLDYQDFCFIAANAHKPINTGYVARLDRKGMKAHRDSLDDLIASGELDPDALYITDSSHLQVFTYVIESKLAEIGYVDNYFYFISKEGGLSKNTTAAVSTDSVAIKKAFAIIGKKNLFKKASFNDTVSKVQVNYNIEGVLSKSQAVTIDGWAFSDSTMDNSGDSIFLTLSNEANQYTAPAQRVLRPDVTQHFKRKFLDNSGFNSIIFYDSVEKGTYRLGILIKNKNGNTVYQETDTRLAVHKEEISSPVKIANLPPEANIVFGVDLFKEKSDKVVIGGWAAFDNQSYIRSVTHLLLKGETGNYTIPLEPLLRPDVTRSRAGKLNLDSTGFNVSFLKSSLPAGTYQVGIMIEDKQEKKQGIVFINKKVISNLQ